MWQLVLDELWLFYLEQKAVQGQEKAKSYSTQFVELKL